MNYDFDELSKLAKTDPEMFELRRALIIAAAIIKAPVHLQDKLLKLQARLDKKRAALSGAAFIDYCSEQVAQNLEDLEDQWRCIQAIAERD